MQLKKLIEEAIQKPLENPLKSQLQNEIEHIHLRQQRMNFYGVTDLWTYVAGAIGIILLPGPNSLYVLSIASSQGIQRGYQAACGVFVGDTVLMLLVALGAATLLHQNPALFTGVKYLGAIYLFWIGANLLWSAYQGMRPTRSASNITPNTTLNTTPSTTPTALPDSDPADALRPSALQPSAMQNPFSRALLISLINPKAILFFLSFFIQFVDPAYPNPGLTYFILGAIVMLGSFLYLSVLIYSGAKLAQTFRARQRMSAGLTGAVGALFIGFGGKLATATL